MEKAFNILFFNFCLVLYYFQKILLVYINPICWIKNVRFIQFGFSCWRDQMEKDFIPFLYQIKYNWNIRFGAFQLQTISFILFFLMISKLLQSFGSWIYIISIIGLLISIIGSYNYIDTKDKYFEFQKEFIRIKKYNKPIIIVVVLSAIIILLIGF
ncbi:MAG: hypothetical protein ACOYOT_06785 [Bacteroidales bacterium]